MRYYQDYTKVNSNIKEVMYPNSKLNVGYIGEYMGQMPQINYLVNSTDKISYSPEFEEESEDRKQRGKRFIPDSKDYYMGEGI